MCWWQCTAVLIVYQLVLALAATEGATTGGYGRATFYGRGDGFTLNDGSCACHKQNRRPSWLSSQCADGFCFDYIGELLWRCTEVLLLHVNIWTCITTSCAVLPERQYANSVHVIVATGVSACAMHAYIVIHLSNMFQRSASKICATNVQAKLLC